MAKVGLEYGKVKICTHYAYKDNAIDYVPTDSQYATPIYQKFSGGWDTTGCKTYDDLPVEAKRYIEFIEEYTHVPVRYIGVGPADTDVIIKA